MRAPVIGRLTSAVCCALSLAGVALSLASLAPMARADDLPEILEPVTDRARVIPDADERRLTRELVAHRARTGVQIGVLLINTTAGMPIEDYALRVARVWKGGTKGRNDGILLVLAVRDRRMRLEVGYGIEPYLSDAQAKRILDGARYQLRGGAYAAAVGSIVRQVMAATASIKPGQPISLPLGQRLPWGFVLVALLGAAVGAYLGPRLPSFAPAEVDESDADDPGLASERDAETPQGSAPDSEVLSLLGSASWSLRRLAALTLLPALTIALVFGLYGVYWFEYTVGYLLFAGVALLVVAFWRRGHEAPSAILALATIAALIYWAIDVYGESTVSLRGGPLVSFIVTFFIVAFVAILLIVISSASGGGSGGNTYGSYNSGGSWSGGSDWGGSSSGSSGGSDWSGGGGDFGGGGASSSW